jgi:ArsR family transcriptional regulator
MMKTAINLRGDTMENLIVKLKALCDENRLKMIAILAGRELCACDLVENLDLTQPTISHHLKVLVESGLISCQKRGKWCFYRVNDAQLKSFLEELSRLAGTRKEDIKLCKSDCNGQRR